MNLGKIGPRLSVFSSLSINHAPFYHVGMLNDSFFILVGLIGSIFPPARLQYFFRGIAKNSVQYSDEFFFQLCFNNVLRIFELFLLQCSMRQEWKSGRLNQCQT